MRNFRLEYSELLIMAVQKRIIFFLPTSGECIIYTLAAVEMWFPALVRGDTIPPLHHSTIAALLMDNCQTESPPDLMRWEPPCRYCNKWAQNSFSVDQYFCTLPSISCFEIEELWQVSLALSWMSECEELRSRWKTSSWQLQCRNEINILQCVLAWRSECPIPSWQHTISSWKYTICAVNRVPDNFILSS